jgi:hypothetical protein
MRVPTIAPAHPEPLPSLYRIKDRVRPSECDKGIDRQGLDPVLRPSETTQAVKVSGAGRIAARDVAEVRNPDPARTEREIGCAPSDAASASSSEAVAPVCPEPLPSLYRIKNRIRPSECNKGIHHQRLDGVSRRPERRKP